MTDTDYSYFLELSMMYPLSPLGKYWVSMVQETIGKLQNNRLVSTTEHSIECSPVHMAMDVPAHAVTYRGPTTC